MINYTKFVQQNIKDTSIYREVDKTADLLFNYLNRPRIIDLINEKINREYIAKKFKKFLLIMQKMS
tara:strand:+ start:493 stop:690 length:198 start_codon:yes stop_codon:yes gene_type:complete